MKKIITVLLSVLLIAGLFTGCNGDALAEMIGGGDTPVPTPTPTPVPTPTPTPEPIEYTVTFNSNGGSAVTSQTVLEGGKATIPTDPTKERYVFSKWYSDAALTTEYDFNTPVTADITLYAKWTAKTFKAVYNTTSGENTLTFFYDALDHSGVNITVYENGTTNYLFDSSKSEGERWGYNDIRGSVKSVVIDSSVANYDELTSTAYMFYYMYYAESVSGAEYLDVSNVTDMSSMFYHYGEYSEILNAVPDVSKWDTSNVTNMSSMFYCYGYYSYVLNAVPDVSKWDTSNVTDMSSMFYCYGYYSYELNAVLDVSKWDTSNVTNMYYMFSGYGECSEILNAVPDVSKWDTSNVTNMSNMFYCYGNYSTELNFTLDLSNWSVAKVTDYTRMFFGAGPNATAWSVTIPEKTGERDNETTKWYVGNGADTSKYIEPSNSRQFTLATP